MTAHPIYTIGHGTRPFPVLLGLLKDFDIRFLLDVRSIPYSKFNPQYNREEFSRGLEENGIKYVYMGDTLGGRPKDPTCYDEDGKVHYGTLKQKDFFRRGIARVRTAYEKNLKVALCCSETDPARCHRSKLIGQVLQEENIEVQHIDQKGELKIFSD